MMKFSMDGFRKQLHVDLNDFKEQLERVIDGKSYDKDDLIESFNIIVQHSNMINCVYSDIEDGFSDLSNLHLKELQSNIYD